MLRANAHTLARVAGGELLCGDGDRAARGLVTDSRAVDTGYVFVALVGERTDGHHHVREAVDRGASVLIISRMDSVSPSELTRAVKRDVAVISVDDGMLAIDRIARWHRSRLLCPVVAITGSSGKTTTKEYVASVLRTRFDVVATPGNRNNELGLPLTLLSAGPETGALVLEMGMRGLGQIAELSAIARPTMGVVTNVGSSHIELLGDRDTIAIAKGELAEALHEGAVLFLNGDDEYSDAIAARSRARVVRFGTTDECEVRADDIELDGEGRPSFNLVTPLGDRRVSLRIPGRHSVHNALAAVAVGLHLALELDEIARGIEHVEPEPMRMQPLRSPHGVIVLNDAYNANPVSMRASVETLVAMECEGTRVAVLGDMAELGSYTELAHFEIGEAVAHSTVGLLITVGERARHIAEGARAAGMPADAIVSVDDAGEVLAVLGGRIGRGDIVLVKASRVMGLEVVVEGIVNVSC